MRTLALAVLLTVAAGVAAPAAAARLLRSEAAGGEVVVEVLADDPAVARQAIAAALAEVRRARAVLDPDGEVLGRLNREAGAGPVAVEPALFELLRRADSFCRWSDGVTGALGGWLFEAWGVRRPVGSRPFPALIARGAELAACDGLRLDAADGTVRLAAGARIDLWPFASGWLVDRAVAVLGDAGLHDLSVRVGRVQRAVGSGPQGDGWPVILTTREVLARQITGVMLRDAALALADEGPVAIGGDPHWPYLDLSTGRPPSGVHAVAVVSEHGVDAQGLAAAFFALGNRRGTHLAGQLRPMPAVVWLLGEGEGEPLVTDLRWSAVRRGRRGG